VGIEECKFTKVLIKDLSFFKDKFLGFLFLMRKKCIFTHIPEQTSIDLNE
tara:strand:- start:7056 stop:7205 length:150 start_codon:yes stop_codon:yes gene_type:complete